MKHNTVATLGAIAFIAACAWAGWTAGGHAFKHTSPYTIGQAHYGQ